MINKTGKSELDKMFEPRVYTDVELLDFHNKIQRFWEEPREVTLPNGMSGTAQKFNHGELHVAFGAARRVEHGKREDGTPIYAYLYNRERHEVFNNLWKQCEDYRKKRDWVDGKEVENLEKLAGVSF